MAALAAVGLFTLLPISLPSDVSILAVPVVALLLTAVLVVGGRRMVARARREAIRSAGTDRETGLATQAAADRVLELEFAAAQRGRPLTVVLIRIEQLAHYRKRHGEVVERQLLRLAGRTLKRHRRGMHLTALYGARPGTYLSILSGMEPAGASVYARRMRHALRSLPGVPTVAGVSAGIVAFDMSMTSAAALLEAAQRALDKGTQAGGKVVVLGQVAADFGD